MPTPYYNSLDDEDKRILKRGVFGIFSLLIGGVLSCVGLIAYMVIAPQPNWTMIEIWLAGTSAAMLLGIRKISGHLARTLPRNQVSDDVGNRTSISN